MKTTTSTVCALALLAFGMSAAQAQSTPTRATVKADAAANAASKPMGEMSTPNQDKGPPARASNTTRAAVKADAAAQPKPAMNGELSVPRRDEMAASGGKAGNMRPGAESRAAVKAEAAAANKPGGDKPVGQMSQKGQEKGQTKP